MPDEPRKMTEERWSRLSGNVVATVQALLDAARCAHEDNEAAEIAARKHVEKAREYFHKVCDCVIMNPGCGQDNGH